MSAGWSRQSSHGASSPIEGIESREEDRASAWRRRVVLGVLVVFVAAGAVGLLGVYPRNVEAHGEGYDLSLRYAAIARPGLDVPFEAEVRRSGGFGKSLTLAITGAYFDAFETQGFHPEPSASTRDGDTLYLEFDAPEGEVFVVSYDAYIQPSIGSSQPSKLALLVDGSAVAEVEFRTRLMP